MSKAAAAEAVAKVATAQTQLTTATTAANSSVAAAQSTASAVPGLATSTVSSVFAVLNTERATRLSAALTGVQNTLTGQITEVRSLSEASLANESANLQSNLTTAQRNVDQEFATAESAFTFAQKPGGRRGRARPRGRAGPDERGVRPGDQGHRRGVAPDRRRRGDREVRPGTVSDAGVQSQTAVSKVPGQSRKLTTSAKTT